MVHYREPHGAYVPMPEQDMKSSRAANLKTPDYPGLNRTHMEAIKDPRIGKIP